MLKILLIALVIGLVLFLWSACVVSGRISREEERSEYEKVKKIMD